MDLLQELEVWYVIPAIRKELALAMKNSGMKQVEIAKRLDLTKSAITQYLNKSRGNEIKFNEDIKSQISDSAKRIENAQDTIREIQHLISITRDQKVACQLHKIMDKNYDSCGICFDQPLVKIGVKK
jgi:predicted transcriptional regulator